MRRLIRLIVFLFLCTSYIAQAETIQLIVATPEDNPLYQVAFRVTQAVAKRMGVDIKLVAMPLARAKYELENSENTVYHGDVGRSMDYIRTSARKLIVVDEPIFLFSVFAYVNVKANFDVTGWESLKPYKIVFVRGSVTLREKLKGYQTFEVNSVQQALQFLNAGRADVFVTDPFSTSSIFKKSSPISAGIKRLENPVDVVPLFTVFLAENARYVKPYQDALIALKKDGTYEKILSDFKQ